MNEIVKLPHPNDKKRVVIIGGGFAGLELAKRLNSKYYQIVLLDKNTYYQFQPLLYQVATGGLEAGSISYPFRKNFQKKKDFHFRMCEAQGVCPENQILYTTIGMISYDFLVIATGSDTNYFGNESLRQNTFPLKSISESLLLRNRILLSFEQAVNDDPGKLEEHLAFVVVGGGATGVELAGALADMRNMVLPKDYPGIDFSKMTIHLVDASPRLLSAMSEEASENAADILEDRGVIIHQNIQVESCKDKVVKMSDGTELVSRNVFWVAGVKPVALPGLKESAYTRGGFLNVDDYCSVGDYQDIFAIGDTAFLSSGAYPKGHPQVAQVAMQMGRRLATNMNLYAKGKYPRVKKFIYKDKGSMATIGRNAAVADIGRHRLQGRPAWWMWLLIHIMFIIGTRNKLMVFIDWVWNYLNYDSSLRLLIKPLYSEMYDPQKNNAHSTCVKNNQ